jgi:hypothetical protein
MPGGVAGEQLTAAPYADQQMLEAAGGRHSAAFFESKTVPKQYQEDGILGFLPFCKQLKKCKLLNLTCGKIVRLPPPPPLCLLLCVIYCARFLRVPRRN